MFGAIHATRIASQTSNRAGAAVVEAVHLEAEFLSERQVQICQRSALVRDDQSAGVQSALSASGKQDRQVFTNVTVAVFHARSVHD